MIRFKNNFLLATKGFDLPKSLDKLRTLQTKKLDDERYGLGNAKSDVVLIIPYTKPLSNPNKDYCIEQIKKMREKVPGKSLIASCKNCKLKLLQ